MRMIFRCDPALADHLPRPVPARSALARLAAAMPAKAHSDIHGRDIRTVKQCPPFVDAMAYGVLILLPCDVRVERGSFSWDWDIPEPATSGHPRAPVELSCRRRSLQAHPSRSDGQAAIKFNSFWTIELEPGWSLFATHPVNRDDLPFRLITGLVDADRFHDGGINFPAIWTQPDFSGVLPKGTPVAQVFAVPRTAPELQFESFDEAHQRPTRRPSREVLRQPQRLSQTFSRAARTSLTGSERAAKRGFIEPQPAVGRRGQRHRDGAEAFGPQAIGSRIGAHGAVEFACFLQHDAEIERGFRMVGF